MNHEIVEIAPETAETTEQDDIKIELSPNGRYLVTHSRRDRSIVGWNVEDIDEGLLKHDHIKNTVKLVDKDGSNKSVIQICVSDDKKLVYIYKYADLDNKKTFIDIIDMNKERENEMNKERENEIKLELYPHDYYYRPYHCTFNLEGEFILYSEVEEDYNNDDKKIIWVYSTQTNKSNEWICKGIHKISEELLPEDFELISISKYDKLYLFSNNYFYEWNMRTEKSIRILTNKNVEEEQHEQYHRIQKKERRQQKELHHKNKVKKTNEIKITGNEKFICLRIKDRTIIYSIELEIPIVDIDNDIQLYNFMKNSELYPLLPSLFDLFACGGIWNSIIEVCWKEFLGRLLKKEQLPKKYRKKFKELTLPKNIRYLKKGATEYAFGILDDFVWKFKFEEKLRNVNSSNFSKEYCSKLNKNRNIVEGWSIYLGSDKLKNKNKNKVIESQSTCLDPDKMIHDKHDNEIECWNYYLDFDELNDIESQSIESSDEDDEIIDKKTYDLNLHLFSPYMDTIRELLENAITNATTNTSAKEENNLIKWEAKIDGDKIILQVFKKVKCNDEWDNDPITTKSIKIENYHTIIASSLLYNNDIVILTTLGLFIYCFIEYNKSISLSYVYSMDLLLSEDRENNLRECQQEFLKDTLPLPGIEFILNVKENKENLLKYGVELLTFAIERHDVDRIEKIYKNCIKYFNGDLENNRKFLSIITSTIPLLNKHYPEYISRFSLDTNMIIDSSSYNVERRSGNRHLYSFSQDPQLINLTSSIQWTKYNYQLRKIKEKNQLIPTITFMIPYIKFVNYSQKYEWWKELYRPRHNSFIEIIKHKEIYQTWTGEVLINFKWKTYGKYYYALIWIGFTAYLGCFTAAATIPPEYLAEDKRENLLYASIVLGLIHISFEIRQFIYDYRKWIHDPWNWLDIIAFLLPIYTSFYWLLVNDKNDRVIQLLSFSCLFLDLKFLLFFRVSKSFGKYFAIIVNVGKKIFSFLAILLIIIISFAHGFYILLSPRSELSFDEPKFNDPKFKDDSNNPWNMNPKFKVFNNGVSDPNQFIIQQPDENTNMFADYGTALFAMYLFLTGDPSALSNWTYKDSPSLVLMMILFSFLVVVYLMNLFIGLLSNAIEESNNSISYLIQMAEILAEIELFYLFPRQRRWKKWFPEVIYYYADFDKAREKVNKMIKDKEWNNEFPVIKRNLLKTLNIENPNKTAKNEALLKKLLERVGHLEDMVDNI